MLNYRELRAMRKAGYFDAARKHNESAMILGLCLMGCGVLILLAVAKQLLLQ